MAIKGLRIKNLLSFGPDTEFLPLGPLNVLIGPNGSGKSNFLEAISLLQAAPKDLSAPIKEMSGIREWLWKGANSPLASVDIEINNSRDQKNTFRHVMYFTEHGGRFELIEERIELERLVEGHNFPYSYYEFQLGRAVIRDHNVEAPQVRELKRESLNPERSILSQFKDPERYPMLAILDSFYNGIGLYREWTFGHHSQLRQEQRADLPTDFLMPAGENLALILHNFPRQTRQRLLEALNVLYPEIKDFRTTVSESRVQLFLEEGSYSIPASRLSDGTLRYLCLLAILCHPKPQPLICIEEPELGLHPDVLPELSRLLVEASERTQIIVTTHSDMLVDAMTERPESVVVCEKHDGMTEMHRLKKEDLTEWLDKYRLGQLWTKGEIGGTRW
jgi:predicted ATPase